MATVIPVRFGAKSEAKVDLTFNPDETIQLKLAPSKGLFLINCAFGDVEPDVFTIKCLGNRDVDPHEINVGETELLFPVYFDYAYVGPEDPLVFVVHNTDTVNAQRFEAVFHYALEVRDRARRLHRARWV
jgi:hypothetical protein